MTVSYCLDSSYRDAKRTVSPNYMMYWLQMLEIFGKSSDIHVGNSYPAWLKYFRNLARGT